MSNPFLNLRKYSDLRDREQKENHATESLAACLQLSSALKQAFVEFLFRDQALPASFSCDELKVATQENAGEFGIVDLYLFIPDRLHIVVEIKVGAPEDAEQLENYSSWLKSLPGEDNDKLLFSLVQFPKRDFPHQILGVQQRHTWHELDSAFRRFAENNDSPEQKTDQNIVEFFRAYLETQKIVTNWKPSDLTGMKAGFLARRALSSIFERLEERLTQILPGRGTPEFTTKILMREWPRLEIGKTTWDAIFGKGYNNKIYLWFCIPDIWQATEHKFYPRIELWNPWYGNDWASTELKLQNWAAQLGAAGFGFIVKTKRSTERNFDLAHSKPPPNPQLIAAERGKDVIGEATLAEIGQDELEERLYQTVTQYAGFIDCLQ